VEQNFLFVLLLQFKHKLCFLYCCEQSLEQYLRLVGFEQFRQSFCTFSFLGLALALLFQIIQHRLEQNLPLESF
jgi:hypothetical protein